MPEVVQEWPVVLQHRHIIPPVVLCGDLNSQPGGLVWQYMSMGEVAIKRPHSGLLSGRQGETAARTMSTDSPESYVLESPSRTLVDAGQDWNGPVASFPSRKREREAGQRCGVLIGECVDVTNATSDVRGVIDYIFSSSISLTQTKVLALPDFISSEEDGELPIIPTKK